ncbi:MAG: hypothetical protein KAT43_02205 [Nanoarchaeota archaeon]|nr:hypothetical protein [Nanoarchaeota archaeon]
MKIYIICVIILISVLAVGCAKQVSINSFDECIAAGNPAMESYPRQCRAGDQTFVEQIDAIPMEEAIAIAEESECVEKGELIRESIMHNDNTNTWWIDLDLEKPGCNPACVVSDVTKMAEINWRCTGLIAE